MHHPQQYRNYLENQGFQSIPNNRKLRINTQPQYTSLKNPPKPSQSTNIRQINIKTPSNNKFSLTRQVRAQTESQKYTSSHESIAHMTPVRQSRLTNIEIPYDTEQLTKNVSKVLSSIEEIETEFRKHSNQNSQAMKRQRSPNSDPFNSDIREADNSTSFIEDLMSKIKRSIKYEQKTDEFIQKEKTQLIKLIKNLNKRLNDKLKEVQNGRERYFKKSTIQQSRFEKRRRIRTEAGDEAESKDQRSSSALEFERSLVQVIQEINNNNKMIDNMKHQLEFLAKKYQNYQNSLKNYRKIQDSIVEIQQVIKKKKEQISRIRKKKFLNQKAIITIEKQNGNIFASNAKDILSTNCSTTTHSGSILSSLKEELTEHTRKKEKLKDKIQLTKMHLNKIQELKEKNNVNKEHYEELVEAIKRLSIELSPPKDINSKITPKSISLSKHNTKPIESSSNSTGPQQSAQHLEFIYKTKKSRLEMLLKTIKRTEEGLKKKYFNLLKEYETMVDHGEQEGRLSETSSPSKSIIKAKSPHKAPIIRIYKEHEKMIDDKLDKSKQEMEKLHIKIQRIGKVGKIAKKINQLEPSQKANHSQSLESQEDYDMEFDSVSDDENKETSNFEKLLEGSQKSRSKFDINNISSHQIQPQKRGSQIISQTSFSREGVTEKSHSLQRINSGATSSYQTPSYNHNQRDDYTQNQSKNRFLTEDDRSFTTELSSVLDKSLIRYDRSQAEENRNNRKYKGKFKKQRILQKSSNYLCQSHPQKDSMALKYQCDTYPIIQEQIQGTSEFDTSGIRQRIQSLSSNQSHSRIVRQNGHIASYTEDHNKKRKHQQNQPIEEELQAQFEMDKLQKELQKQQKEEQMKQKFAKILFRNNLFSS